MSDSISDRFAKLRSLRTNLCEKQKDWQEAFKAKDWIADQLREILKMAQDDQCSQEELIDRIEDVLCVLDPEDKENEDDN